MLSLKRPLVLLCAVTVSSLCLFTRLSYLALLPGLLVAVAVGILFRGKLFGGTSSGLKVRPVVLAATAIFLTVYPFIFQAAYMNRVKEEACRLSESGQSEFYGVVTGLSCRDDMTTVYLELRGKEAAGLQKELCVLKLPSDGEQPALFDRLCLTGTLLPLEDPAAGKTLSGNRLPYYGYGARLTVKTKDIRFLGSVPEEERNLRERVYFWLRPRLERFFDGDTLPFALALLTGDRSSIALERLSAFRLAGLLPFLCISGLHVMLAAGMLKRFLTALRLPRSIRAVFLLLFLVGITMVTGGTNSVLRACLMATVLWAAPLFGRNYDPVSSLAVAWLILWLRNPYCTFNLGTQLSFAATLGVILAGQLCESLPSPGFGKWLFPTLSGSLYALGFTALLTMNAFSGVYLLTPFSTLAAGVFFVPAMHLLAVSALLCLVPVAVPLTALLGKLSGMFLQGFELVADSFAGISGAYVLCSVPKGAALLFSLLGGVLLWCLAFRGKTDENAAALAVSAAPLIPLSMAVLSAALKSFGG